MRCNMCADEFIHLTLVVWLFILLPQFSVFSAVNFFDQGGIMTSYTCKSCGKISAEGGHLCDPTKAGELYSCKSCGQQAKNKKHLCKPQIAKFEFFCGGCGRGAVKEDELCDPQPIK